MREWKSLAKGGAGKGLRGCAAGRQLEDRGSTPYLGAGGDGLLGCADQALDVHDALARDLAGVLHHALAHGRVVGKEDGLQAARGARGLGV